MDDNWADIFTDAEACTAEYSDTDSDDSAYIPRTDYDFDTVYSEEDPAIQYILEVMDSLDINLTIFLDVVSWEMGNVQPMQRYSMDDQV